jgi:uncharacterized membrane protein
MQRILDAAFQFMPRQIRLEHLISFSDAIFAFSITFMAVTIQIPDLPENLNQSQVINRLGELVTYFEIYVLSFFVIGAYWISYHQISNYLIKNHSGMLWLTLVFLFFITLIPFAVDLQVQYGFYFFIFAIYALVLTLTGLILFLIWLHAKKNQLIDEKLSPIEIQGISLQSGILPAIFAISILIAIINTDIAYYFWILIVPLKIIIYKKYPH